jgi:fimbrial chaperone protein
MRFTLAAATSLLCATSALAGNLEISPVNVEVVAPAAASTVTLKNAGDTPVKMQARLFSWSQNAQGEQLNKTNAVVVSPPFVDLKPGEKAVVRIVRLSKQPLAREESYRLMVDELPKKVTASGPTIQMVMRYSVPVFFASDQKTAPSVEMGIQQNGGKLTIAISNKGSAHLKLSGMKATDAAGHVVSFGNGLNGYVLAGASNSFSARGAKKLAGSSVTVSVNSNFGQLVKTIQLR